MAEILDKYVEPAVFWLAAAAVLLAFLEGFLQLLGMSLTARAYSAGRLLELATMMMVFAAVLNLRGIRAEIGKRD